MVYRRALGPDRGRLLTTLNDWVEGALGARPNDPSLYTRALTHGSAGGDSYQRLEFLGDRVLGLVIARWLYVAYPLEPEGQLSKRLNALVTGAVCAEVAREIGVSAHLKLGKQARDDGAFDSDNILGDVTEALIVDHCGVGTAACPASACAVTWIAANWLNSSASPITPHIGTAPWYFTLLIAVAAASASIAAPVMWPPIEWPVM